MSRCMSGILCGCVAAALALAAAPARAKDDPKTEAGILLGAGFGDKHLVGDDRTDKANLLLGLRIGHFFHPQFQWFGDATLTTYTSDLINGNSTEEQALRTGIEWVAMPRHDWRPFINLGVGYAHHKPYSLDAFDRGFGSAAIGVRGLVSDTVSVRFEGRVDHDVTDGGKYTNEKFTNYKALFGLMWGFGPPADSDGDGVPNRRDKCPDTPHGAMVDKNGCPTDADGDKVWDGLDKCPNTPAGWPVDASGCPIDSDGDGVADGADKCPSTPRGCKVDGAGCPIDSDGDGVCDGVDRCPGTQRGCKVDASGCPLDGDGDGICDGIDRCPGTPKGDKVDTSGCTIVEPKKEEIVFAPKEVLVLSGAKFDYDKATLRDDAKETLDKVARGLKAHPEVKIEVGGHTDSRGSDAYNKKLSMARAQAVVDYLVAQGVPASQLTPKGYGKADPIADNKTDEGRAKNRRVELKRIE